MDTNQIQMMDASDEAFAEELISEVEITPDETETDVVQDTTAADKAEEPFLNIRYNKEDIGLTKDQAVELAQKGKNYDHILDKYNSLNDRLDQLAKMNGMDVEKYISSLNDTQMKFEQNKEFASLKQMYPDADETLLKELADKRVDERIQSNIAKSQEKAKEETDSHNAEIKRQVELFHKVYPKLEADKLDSKVYDLMQDGYTLLEAYSIYKDGKQETIATEQLKSDQIKKLNDENKAKSLGNIGNVGDIEADDFFSGFDSMF